ncbi:hypothetical protein BS424_17365 [Cronobacter sakazakii]|nr:hypothetical protein CDT91_04650 [Cronobacter sakazakii]PUX19819.1 hypothetical protein BS410_22555 [Cronobacter sakazakii]PUX43977.1 hypothetical protein BS424_17365 [Cronobacter sakazakii]
MQLASIASFELSTPLILINSRSHTDSPGIAPSHPVDVLRTLQILLPYLTSNKWLAAKKKGRLCGLISRCVSDVGH